MGRDKVGVLGWSHVEGMREWVHGASQSIKSATSSLTTMTQEPRRTGSKLGGYQASVGADREPQRQRSRLRGSSTVHRPRIPTLSSSTLSEALLGRQSTSSSLSMTVPSLEDVPLGQGIQPATAAVLPLSDPLAPVGLAPPDERLADYWFALTHLGGVYRLESSHFVVQDWDSKEECLQVCHSGRLLCHL